MSLFLNCGIYALKCCVSFCYTAVKQLHVYIYPLFFGFPSHLGHQKHWVKFPVLYSRFSVISFIHSINTVDILIPISQLIPPLPSSLSVYMFIFHVCVSISDLQIVSPVPSFKPPHIYVNRQYLSLSDLLHSVLQRANDMISFLSMAKSVSHPVFSKMWTFFWSAHWL